MYLPEPDLCSEKTGFWLNFYITHQVQAGWGSNRKFLFIQKLKERKQKLVILERERKNITVQILIYFTTIKNTFER